jgi:hypothetical protein
MQARNLCICSTLFSNDPWEFYEIFLGFMRFLKTKGLVNKVCGDYGPRTSAVCVSRPLSALGMNKPHLPR